MHSKLRVAAVAVFTIATLAFGSGVSASAQTVTDNSSTEPASPIADLRQDSADCSRSVQAGGVNISDNDLTVSLEWYNPDNFAWELVTVDGGASIDGDFVFTDNVAKIKVPASSGGYAHSFTVTSFQMDTRTVDDFRLVYAVEQQAENSTPKMAFPSFSSQSFSPDNPKCVAFPAL